MHPQNELVDRIERARLWPLFHKEWIIALRDDARRQLPSDYFVFVESEVVTVSSPWDPHEDRRYSPDIIVTRGLDSPRESISATPAATGVMLEVEEAIETETQYSLAIRRSAEGELVAALELLSPSNKGVGSRTDLDRHRRKRETMLAAQVNLLEIDVLQQGERDLPPNLTRLHDCARVAWSAHHQPGKRTYRGWGWNDDQAPPTLHWRVDAAHELTLPLADSLAAAARFNDWERLLQPR